MEKKKTSMRIAGRDYTLYSSDTLEHLNRVAAYVDRQMAEMSFATRQSKETVAVYVSINLADELMKAQEENSRLRRELHALREKH